MGGDKGGYTIIDNAILQHYLPLLGTGPFALWCLLRKRCNPWDRTKGQGECFATLNSLAEALNLTHRRDVLAYRKPLLDAGLLKILRKGHSAGYATYYAVIVPQETTLLDVVQNATRKLRVNGRKKKITCAVTGTCAKCGPRKTRQPVPYMAKTSAVTGTTPVPQLAHQQEVVQHNNKQCDIADKPSTQQNNPLEAIPGTPLNAEEYLGKKYLEGKSPDELQALEERARKEMKEAGIGENIIRVALRTQMALIAKEEAEG